MIVTIVITVNDCYWLLLYVNNDYYCCLLMAVNHCDAPMACLPGTVRVLKEVTTMSLPLAKPRGSEGARFQEVQGGTWAGHSGDFMGISWGQPWNMGCFYGIFKQVLVIQAHVWWLDNIF